MGVVANIYYENYPEQSRYFSPGTRVIVCYKYDTSRTHEGVIVRNDADEPFETIIKLDNGRYLRAKECQYQMLREE